MKARKEEAEDIFARWLESVEKGDAPPFAELQSQHPEHAQELERLFDNWEKFPALQPLAPGAHSDSDLFRGPQSLGDSKALLTHGKRIGRYELERELGRGGMGVVWLARDLVLGDHVALKFLPQVLTADRIAMLRLRREAKVLLALTHTNIVRLRTIESSSGLTFLIEEFLAGPTLAELLEERLERNERGLACAEVRWLIEQLAPALEYAHGEGVTHRDIKPSNMMLDALPGEALGEGRERAKLTDFGLAFVANSALSQISSYRPSGTLPYMAPEVLMGGKPTPAADIYSLGVTVYCLVAGRPPFTHGDIAAQILHSRPERLESGDKHIDAAVRAAMAKHPENRPASVLDFLAILRGEKKAPGPSRRALLKRFATVAVTIALAGAGWFAWQELARREAQPPLAAAPAESIQPALLPVTVQLDDPFGRGEKHVVVGGRQSALLLRGHITNARSQEFAVILGGIRQRADLKPDGSFFVQQPLVPGTPSNVRIEIEGADPIEFEVELDQDKPVLELVEPSSSPWTTSAKSIDLEVRVEERNPVSVHVGDLALESLGEGRWRSSSVSLQPGDNALTLRATDAAGNTDSLTIHVVQESRSITLVACEPSRGSQVYLREPAPLKLTFDHPIESASFAGKPLTLAADARSAMGEFVADTLGTWRGSWSARDPYGEEESGELDFVVAVRGRVPEVGGREFKPLDREPGWNRWARRIQDPASRIVFRLVDPGAFRMGSRPLTARMDEEPWREVHISQPFYLAETEVTRAQWRTFADLKTWQTSAERTRKAIARVPGNTGKAQERDGANWQVPEPDQTVELDDTHPVSQLSWHDARAFCAHFGFRLPTEAEWEYACRAGSSSIYPWGDRAEGIEQRANLADASLAARLPNLAGKALDGHVFSAPVGSFAANLWGFKDMLGNVWEWCEDAYDPAAYLSEELDPLAVIVGGPKASIELDPAVTTSDAERSRVLRGGSWLTPASEARASRRAFDLPDRASDTRGFRPAFTPEALGTPTLLSPAPDYSPPLTLTLAHPGGARRISLLCVRDNEGNLVAHGEYTRYYLDNQKAEIGKFEQGNRTGPWREYHNNRKPRAVGSYYQDRRVRDWEFWYENGARRANGSYTQGRVDGRWEFLLPDGSKDFLHSGTYDHLDLPRGEGEGTTLDDKSHGWWTFQWPNGIRRLEGTYQRGQRAGAWRFWHPEGTYDSQMLSGIYEDDSRITLGDEVWLPATGDHVALPIDSFEVDDLLALLGTDAFGSNRQADLLKTICEAPEAEVEKLLEVLDRASNVAVPQLVRMLLTLDLQDGADVRKGQRLMAAWKRICNSRTYPWSEATSPEGSDFNRLQVLRATSLWLMTRASSTFWELEIDAGGDPKDPILLAANVCPTDHILATTEDAFLAKILRGRYQNPLLYAPPQYGQPPSTDTRLGPFPARVSRQREASQNKDRRTTDAIESALSWLAIHQSIDGNWDCDGFPALCRKNQCGGIGSTAHDIGITGLALLAFLGADNSALTGRHKKTVRDGVLWLVRQQDSDGIFGEWIGPDYIYNHAIAAQAVCQALARTPADVLRRSAEKAVKAIHQAQNPYSAWRYSIPPDGDNDTSVTARMVIALASARDAGLSVDPETLTNAMNWIDQMTNPSNGRTGYTDMGGLPTRIPRLTAQFPPELSESMTAAGVLTRILAGHTTEGDPMIEAGADVMDRCLPTWDDVGHIDFYYWYLGTLAMHELGGPRWERWNGAIKSAILDHQRLDVSGDEFGSWDPVDPWGSSGGRVYSTAILALTLEASTGDPPRRK